MEFTDDDDIHSSSTGSGNDDDGILPSNAAVKTKYRRRDVDRTNRLTPGSHLQACNGTDIHLARGATVPSTAVIAPPKKGKAGKTKQRYLLLWPGIVSLNPNRTSSILEDNGKNSENNEENNMSEGNVANKKTDEDDDGEYNFDDDDDVQEDDNLEDDDKNRSTKSSAIVSTSSGSAVTTLGTLKGLDTDYPTMNIPFPGKPGQALTLEGRKIQSASKFMMLTCSKKGIVTCKNIFSSVVVFGDATFHGETLPKSTALTDDAMVDLEEEEEEEKESKIPTSNGTLHHFGGSDRTADGGQVAKGLKSGRVIVAPAKRRKQETVIGRVRESDNDGDDGGSVPTKRSNNVNLTNESDSDDSDEFKAKIVIPPKRNAPRRSTSTKEVKYDFPSSSDEEEESGSEDEKEDTKTKKRPTARKTMPRGTIASKPSKTDTISIDDSDESGDDAGGHEENKNPARSISKVSPRKRRASTGSKRASKDDIDHSDFEIDLGKYVEHSNNPLRAPSRRKSAAKKKQYVEVNESESNDEEDIDANSEDDSAKAGKGPIGMKTKGTEKHVAPKRPKGVSQKRSAVELSSSDEDDVDSDDDDDDGDSDFAEETKPKRPKLSTSASKRSITAPRKKSAFKVATNSKKVTVARKAATKVKMSDESDGSDTDALIKSARTTVKTARCKNSKTAEMRSSSGDESDFEEQPAKLKPRRSSGGRSSGGRSSRAKKVETITLDDDSEMSDREEKKDDNEASSCKQDTTMPEATSTQKPPVAKRKYTDEGGNPSSDESRVSIGDVKTPSPNPGSRRRRKTSPTKKISRFKISDLSNDDEFNFLG